MPAPSWAANGTPLAGSTSTTVNMAAPASIAINNILLARLYVESTATVVSAGWTEAQGSPVINATGGSLHRLHIFWKRAVVGDVGASTYSFTGSTGYRSGIMSRFTDCVLFGDPFDFFSASNTAAAGSASTTTPAVSLTTYGADRLLVHQISNYAGGAIGTPTGGFTERDENDGQTMSTKVQAIAGASGSTSATAAQSGVISAWLGALKPVDAGGMFFSM